MYWYVIDNKGRATLCNDKKDAEKVAKESDQFYPMGAPHIAVLMKDSRLNDADMSAAIASFKVRA